MKFKGIIFDLDGVICSTDRHHYNAWKKISDENGLYFDEAMNNKLRGVSRAESLEIILRENKRTFSEEKKQQLLEKKNAFYIEELNFLNASAMKNDVPATLEKIKKGAKIAIGSSSKNTQFILNKLGIKNLFNAVCDGTMISKSKPDPEVFLLAAKSLKLKPCECLVVEDSIAGIDAAEAGGFKSAGIGDAAKYDKATYSIEKLSDLILIVQN